jgi:hypothetical protein
MHIEVSRFGILQESYIYYVHDLKLLDLFLNHLDHEIYTMLSQQDGLSKLDTK